MLDQQKALNSPLESIPLQHSKKIDFYFQENQKSNFNLITKKKEFKSTYKEWIIKNDMRSR